MTCGTGAYVYEADLDKWRMYLIALYWSLQTLTSVGYGDVGGDQTTYEVYAACFGIYVGTIAFGWIIGNVTAIVMEEDRVTFTVKTKISELSSYMQQRQLSRPLRKRIAQYYDTKWKSSTVFDEASVLLELPSYLRDELVAESYIPLIKDVPMLRVLPPSMLAIIMTKLKAQRVLETQVVITKGSIGTEMFIITAGLLRVWYDDYKHANFMLGEEQLETAAPMLPGTVPDAPNRHPAADGVPTPDGGGLLGRGDAFGDYTLTETSIGRVHPYTVTCVTNSLLLALSRKDYRATLLYFPELPSELKHAVADRNADGQISKQELRSVLPMTVQDDEVAELLAQYGESDDGGERRLSYAQFDKLVDAAKPHHRPASLISPSKTSMARVHPSAGLLQRSESEVGKSALKLENATLEAELARQKTAIAACKTKVEALKVKLGI